MKTHSKEIVQVVDDWWNMMLFSIHDRKSTKTLNNLGQTWAQTVG